MLIKVIAVKQMNVRKVVFLLKRSTLFCRDVYLSLMLKQKTTIQWQHMFIFKADLLLDIMLVFQVHK